MAKNYDHKAIEEKWQEAWEKNGLYRTPDSVEGKENFYQLVEFVYPSGNLHAGHWYAFAVPDIFVRMRRMRGDNILYPMGFDAFGLPAENAAIKNGLDPAKWTFENIEKMRAQLRSMGNAFDWSRAVITATPEYYRWTQWLFLKLYEKGLAYRNRAVVNWDPVDKTVLANEQVLPDGTAERSGAKVEKKQLEQWFFKITAYADRLIDDLTDLAWPEPIKEAQRSWIGRSEGAEIVFPLRLPAIPSGIKVFTTRPDTLYGATFLVLAPEHPLIQTLATVTVNCNDVQEYVERAKRKSELDRMAHKEKTGMRLEGVTAINPATGKEIPVFVADYVLGSYGTGAIMAVPAHDERDKEFAEMHSLPTIEVINPQETLVNSGSFNGLSIQEAKQKITEAFGAPKIIYKFRDWLISRQRYWGAPIPIVYDPEGKAHPIPEEHLPWTLPTDVDFTPTGEAPLARSKELKERTEKIFGAGWRPETDTMDVFVDSSWYFLRYLDPKNDREFASIEKQKAWMPIARYSGGSEHTTVHVLYSRFFQKALFDLGLTTEPEPYKVRMNRGIILAEDGRKMSKRWGNVVNPDEQVENVGADAVRTYLAFIGPYNEVGAFPWSTNGLIGVRRFLERVAGLSEKVKNVPVSEASETLMHQTIKKVTDDIESFKFNTSVSQLMLFSNELGKTDVVPKAAYEVLLKLLVPFAPHLADELWHEIGNIKTIHQGMWPECDASKLIANEVTVAVQIGGKTKGTITIRATASEKEAIAAVVADPKLGGLVPENQKRVIYVAGRIINFIP